MTIKGVLFDFGNTLISIELDWEKILPLNIANMVRYLRSQNYQVDIEPFGKRFLELKHQKHQQGQKDLIEYTSVNVLKEVFAEYNLNHIDNTILENAVEAFFEPEKKLYPVIAGAHEVLQVLKDRGYKLALVSNASSGKLIYSAMEHLDFTKYFDVTIVSADIGYRKPHPQIFQMALEKLHISPQEAVMIGDVPAYDIAGSKILGMKSILVNYLESTEGKKNLTDIQPDAIAHKITDIPNIIESWK